MCVFVSALAGVSVYACVCVCMYVYMCVCLYVCICVCVCGGLQTHHKHVELRITLLAPDVQRRVINIAMYVSLVI